MRQDVCVVDDIDVLVETPKLTKPILEDEISTHNLDPLIQPLIDTNELDDQLNNLEKKCPSHLSIHSTKQQQQQQQNSCAQICRRCRGIFYALLGSSLFTCSGFIIKQLHVDFFDTLLCRFIIQTSLLIIFISYKKYQVIHGSFNLIILQIIRVTLASSGLLLFYLSYRYIPLPDLTTFRYTQVIWTAIIAMIIFHERISIPTILAIIFTLVGVTCVAQPTFLFSNYQNLTNTNMTMTEKYDKSSRILGLSFALGCALSISGSIVLNKKLLVLKIPQSVLIFQFSFVNLFILFLNHLRNRFILELYVNKTMFTWQYLIAASVSLIQLFSSTITQKAIKLEHPSVVSVVQSSDILFAILLQNLFSNEKSNWLVLIGSALVTTSIFLVGIHKLWNDRKIVSNETNDH